jgi:type I restriction enzyme R subunit
MTFNENSRVKIPAILHLCRLGYDYLSLKGANWDINTNIFVDIFKESIKKLNPDLSTTEINRFYEEVSLCLENEDLGKSFYEKLTNKSGIRMIDFENFENNFFQVTTELTYKKDDEEFRPDVILLINGLPLVFIEVKKPNNHDGILAEHKRIETRFKNKKFRKFVNITQLMVFSNNMDYSDDVALHLEGAFYATASYQKPGFNYFREEEKFDLENILLPLNDTIELSVLKDNNLVSIKDSVEFITNKNPDTPTHRIFNSLFQKNRLSFFLQYSIAYVKEEGGLQKHIMRYPQLFATKAIEAKLEAGIKKGIIWHTQGSGKTALAFYNVKYLTDYFQKKGIVPKFYFIVDRIDLLIQSGKEFRSRGLVVHEINSRDEFTKDIKATTVIHNDSGNAEITVVNIQKFAEDSDIIKNNDYQLNIQRIYFLDEVHRSYNPKGDFLANLYESDRGAIKIGLTGTPRLGNDAKSSKLFGDYIHTYYYNSSIADGYTLRLIREEIETSYKLIMKRALEEIEILKGDAEKKLVYAHEKFVEPMLDYIVKDFENSRIIMNDNSIGAMVVCDSADQAKKMQEIFLAKYGNSDPANETNSNSNPQQLSYRDRQKLDAKVTTSAVILHDVETKEERKKLVEDFKDKKIDILFVFNMLLTGFDAPRLKKLYVGRVISAHNLLQALTRVNRTYKDFKYGYVVDFADIQNEFDKTNKDYFKELQTALTIGNELQHYSNIFKTQEEITNEIENIKDILFQFDINNAEIFSQQVTQIKDRADMVKITKALNSAKELYNIIRMSGKYELLEKLDFNKLSVLSREADNHLILINTKYALENSVDTTNLLNLALEDVVFAFVKVKEEEMVLADQLKNILQKTRLALGGNFDQKDPHFISLKEELERLFKKKNLNEVNKEELESNIKELDSIYKKAIELDRKNQLLKAKYDNDEKYARLHKRLFEKKTLTISERKLFETLQGLKQEVDSQILQNSKMLDNESYIEKMMLRMVINQLNNKSQLGLDQKDVTEINNLIKNEYLNEYKGKIAA